MSNKQEATWHDGKECPGTPHRGHVGVPKSFNGICSGGTSAVYDLANDVVRHYDGSRCMHPEVAPPGGEGGNVRMAITEDPVFGASIPWQPQGRPGEKPEDLPLPEWVGQALGAASSCWSDLPNAGVFDSTRCAAINEALMAHLNGLFAAFVKEAEERRRVSDAYLRSELPKPIQSGEDVTFDDKTLEKVRSALHYILGGNIKDQRLTDCIGEMQNRGILFRERVGGA